MRFIFVPFLAIFLLVAPHRALATMCSRNSAPLEDSFIHADLVFSGIAGKTVRPPIPTSGEWRPKAHVLFQITTLYKSPFSGIGPHPPVLLDTTDMSFIPGQTYIVFGYVRHISGHSGFEFFTSPCSGTRIEPGHLSAFIKQWKDQPDRLAVLHLGPNVLIFEGHVKDVYAWETEQKRADETPFKFRSVSDTVRSKLTVTDVLINTTSEPAPKVGEDIAVYAYTPCSQDLVGQDYLIFASPNHGHHPEIKTLSSELWWSAGCSDYLFSEENLLSRLGDRF
jgi:hypothetical protein